MTNNIVGFLYIICFCLMVLGIVGAMIHICPAPYNGPWHIELDIYVPNQPVESVRVDERPFRENDLTYYLKDGIVNTTEHATKIVYRRSK